VGVGRARGKGSVVRGTMIKLVISRLTDIRKGHLRKRAEREKGGRGGYTRDINGTGCGVRTYKI